MYCRWCVNCGCSGDREGRREGECRRCGPVHQGRLTPPYTLLLLFLHRLVPLPSNLLLGVRRILKTHRASLGHDCLHYLLSLFEVWAPGNNLGLCVCGCGCVGQWVDVGVWMGVSVLLPSGPCYN